MSLTVAHEGESLADFAREFKIENSMFFSLMTIDSRLRMSSVFAAGTLVLHGWRTNQLACGMILRLR